MNIIQNFLEIKLPHFYICLLLFIYTKIFLFYLFCLTINNLLKNIVIEWNKRKGLYNNIHVYWEKTTVEGQYPPNWTPPKEVPYDDLLAQLNYLNEFINYLFYFIPIFSLILVLLFFFFVFHFLKRQRKTIRCRRQIKRRQNVPFLQAACDRVID